MNYWLSGWFANGAMQLAVSVMFGVVPSYMIAVVICFILASYGLIVREERK